MNWDDFKIFLAVARRKKLSDAASYLQMDETTVSRRLKRLETVLGSTLFERLRTGHELTTHGQDLLIHAEEIEHQAESISINQKGTRYKPSGVLRISVAEGFGACLLAPLLGKFTDAYPDIEIDLVSGSGFLSLSKREADIAIGLAHSKSRNIHSERLSDYSLHLYGSDDYLLRNNSVTTLSNLTEHDFIDYVDDLIYAEELRYFSMVLPKITPKYRSTSIMAQKRFVEAGMGLAILPDFLASDELKKVLPKQLTLQRTFWYSVHDSASNLAKVKAFKGFLFTNVANKLAERS